MFNVFMSLQHLKEGPVEQRNLRKDEFESASAAGSEITGEERVILREMADGQVEQKDARCMLFYEFFEERKSCELNYIFVYTM